MSEPVPTATDQQQAPLAGHPGSATGRTGGASLHRIVAAAVGLWLLFSGVYALAAGGHTYSSDEEGYLATTEALVERRSVTVPISDDNAGVIPWRAGRTGAPVGVGGIGQPLASIPLFLVGKAVSVGMPATGETFAIRTAVGWTNALITAAGVAVLYLLACCFTSSRRAILIALAYGFGTMAFPHAKTFFSEPLATTGALVGAYFAVRLAHEHHWRFGVYAGAGLGVSLLARSSGVVLLPVLGVYLLWRARTPGFLLRTLQWASGVGTGMAVPVAVLFGTNWWRFGSALDFGYASVPLEHPVLEGLYGLLLSPGKSLLLYAPPVAVGLVAGLVALVRCPLHRPEVLLFLSLGGVNVLFFARFVHWHGDHAWGPRYLMLTVPFWILPAAFAMKGVAWRRALAAAGAIGLLISSLGVVMYFNQYFHIVEQRVGLEMLPDGPSYWRKMHFDAYWSPVLGHARQLPDIVENTVEGLDGPEAPVPAATNTNYGWHFAPPQADSWVYWVFAANGPKRLLVFAPLWVGVSAIGIARLRTSGAS